MGHPAEQTAVVKVGVYVRPSSQVTAVGGEYDGALVIRVVEPAESGRATSAAIRALASALGVPRRSVTLHGGATSRRKVLEVAVAADRNAEIRRVVDQLLSAGMDREDEI